MNVRYWDPWADVLQAQRDMDRLFDQVFGQAGSRRAVVGEGDEKTTYLLPVDILEDKGAYKLTASVPGFAPEDVDVTWHEGVLAIEAKAPDRKVEGTWLRKERGYGSASRRLQLPSQIEPDRISASFENGVLTVTVPKAQAAQPVKIAVNGVPPRLEPGQTSP
ncbi:MAG TPA: Hsp20/alpha crystallin family protein [Candidatus Dormibacteraeota bacterium]|jgi:HSP20 family protein|nr:Hsp20/alpha crystallin family protein [Candidatus Dormibacteraeota bacterium]